MMLRYLEWVMDQVGSGACREDRDPISEFLDNPVVLAVYLRFLVYVRQQVPNM
jgi:hypothetical protein